MKLHTAKDTLKSFIRQDRIMRNYDTTTDYQQFCEDKCVAMEVVLNALESSQDVLLRQDKFILELFGDIDLNDALKDKYMEKYNKLQINIK